jgi:hypothetical protein
MALFPQNATTKEQYVLETLTTMRLDIAAARLLVPAIPLGALAVTQAIDLANSRTTFTVTLPITSVVGNDGGVEIDAVTFLP